MYGLIVHKPSFKRLKWQLMIYSVPVTVEPTNKFWNIEAFSDNFYVLRHNAGQKRGQLTVFTSQVCFRTFQEGREEERELSLTDKHQRT